MERVEVPAQRLCGTGSNPTSQLLVAIATEIHLRVLRGSGYPLGIFSLYTLATSALF